MKRIAQLLASLALLFVAACNDNLPPQPDPQSNTDFRNIVWKLVSIESNGQIQTIDPSTSITVSFAATTFAGAGPCSRYTGSYTVDDASMSIPGNDFVGGDAACAAAALQSQYYDALKAVGSYLATTTTLRLYASGGSVVLNYIKSSGNPVDTTSRTTIRGITWELDRIESFGTVDRPEPGPGKAVTISFSADGDGFAGAALCNPYGGTYTVKGTSDISLTLTSIGNVTCDGSEFDRKYLRILGPNMKYAATDSTLVLSDSEHRIFYRKHTRPTQPPSRPSFVRTDWRLTGIARGGILQGVGNHRIKINFDSNGSFSGVGTCSRYEGSYTTTGASIAVQEVSAEDANCLRTGFENEYFGLLKRANHWVHVDSTLAISFPNGTLYYTRMALGRNPPVIDPELVSTTWRLESVIAPGQAAWKLDSLSLLTFRQDGTYAGNGNCNTFKGRYETFGPTMTTFEQSNSTLECEGRLREQLYFSRFPIIEAYKINDGRLMLYTDLEVMTYRPYR